MIANADNSALVTGWFTVGGSAVTGVLTYFITSRSIRASNKQTLDQMSHDGTQREADRVNQLRAVQLAAHDASVRKSYIVIQKYIRFTDLWVERMRVSVVTGTAGDAMIPPSDSEADYAEVDLTISGPARAVYLHMREAQKKLQDAYVVIKDQRETGAFGPGPVTGEDARNAFFDAQSLFSQCTNLMTEQMRSDLDPAQTM